MKRRDFLGGGAVGLVAGAAGGYLLRGATVSEPAVAPTPQATPPTAPAIVKAVKQLTMVTSWARDWPGLGTAADRLAKRIEQATEGGITIKVHAGGELVPALKCHDAVQEGAADLYHSADYYYQSKITAYSFFTAVPAGFSGAEINAWIEHGGGQALWDEVGSQFGLKHLACGNTGHQAGGWFRREIAGIDDFKGMKIRIPGLGGEVIQALGATPVTLALTDILPAFEAGTVDASEWIGPWNDLAFGFHRVAKNYYLPGFHEPGSVLSLGINRRVWDGLTETEKSIFTSCAAAENGYSRSEFEARNAEALQTLVRDHEVKLREFPDPLFEAILTASRDVVATSAARDPLSTKVYEAYSTFRKTMLAWTSASNRAYFNKRALVSFDS